MIKIEYPLYNPLIKREDRREYIFDAIRKKWVVLSPEEWVRQNFLQYLVQVKKYPASLLSIEKEIRLGELKKRYDIVVYNTDAQPWMVIECKEMQVNLNEKVLDQILRYNMALNVPYLVITNGVYCFAFSRLDGSFRYLDKLPDWGK